MCAQEKYDYATYIKAIDLYEEIVQRYEKIATLNEIQVSYLEFGEENALPFIWLHGQGSTGYEIVSVCDELVSLGCRVISMDYRGHGKTLAELNEYNTSVYHIADDVKALMDYLNIDSALVGGLSKGAWIASAFYDTFPSRVLGLLLEDGGSYSCYRLADEMQLKSVVSCPSPYPHEFNEQLCDHSACYSRRYDAFKAVWNAFTPALGNKEFDVNYYVYLLSTLTSSNKKLWKYHFDAKKYMAHSQSGRESGSTFSAPAYYSRLPLMQQSQELMNPIIVFRNLDVPLHIIDVRAGWCPVSHQNEELYSLHPNLVTHEKYSGPTDVYRIHIRYSGKFINSVKSLLQKISMPCTDSSR